MHLTPESYAYLIQRINQKNDGSSWGHWDAIQIGAWVMEAVAQKQKEYPVEQPEGTSTEILFKWWNF